MTGYNSGPIDMNERNFLPTGLISISGTKIRIEIGPHTGDGEGHGYSGTENPFW